MRFIELTEESKYTDDGIKISINSESISEVEKGEYEELTSVILNNGYGHKVIESYEEVVELIKDKSEKYHPIKNPLKAITRKEK